VAVNGAVKQPTPAQLRALTGPPLSSTFDVYERMFASFDMGTVFDYGTADARDLREMLRRDGNARKIEQVLTAKPSSSRICSPTSLMRSSRG
jgi:hypothetical protein